MLTKAIIQSVDYTKNICRVRIPLFENASRNVKIIEADAQFSIVPGVYNSYKTGDVVFIGFEENKMELPVILGKLFVSASSEASSYRGNLSGNSLAVTETAQLPYSTVFNYDSISQNSTLYKNLNTPKKLADSIIELQRAQEQKTSFSAATSPEVTTDLMVYLDEKFGSIEEVLESIKETLRKHDKHDCKDSPLPIEVSTEEELRALLLRAPEGSIYKYTGETTDTHEHGGIYVLEEVTSNGNN